MIPRIRENIGRIDNWVGLLAAGLTAAAAPHWWSAIFLILSLAFSRANAGPLGSTISSVVNRIAEVLWAVTFYRLGVSLTWVFAFASLAAFQEYAKARLASSGIDWAGRLNQADRPIRAGFLFLAIFTYQFDPSHSGVTAIAIGLTLVQILSFFLLLRYAFKHLH
jgi:archaetidylinositol phosphate synthase